MSFWSFPLFTNINFENSISQTRDLLAGERNFLIAVRTSFVIAVSALSVLFQTKTHTYFDWSLSGVLLALSLLFPIVALVNYSLQFDAYYREVARVHTSKWLIGCVLAVAVCDVLVAVNAMAR